LAKVIHNPKVKLALVRLFLDVLYQSGDY